MEAELVLSKRMVRGMPLYKVQWKGKSKQQATWQRPPFDRSLKDVINQFERKQWGTTLEEIFFNQELYELHRLKFQGKKRNKKENWKSKKQTIQEKQSDKAREQAEQVQPAGEKGMAEFKKARQSLLASECLNTFSLKLKEGALEALAKKKKVNKKQKKAEEESHQSQVSILSPEEVRQIQQREQIKEISSIKFSRSSPGASKVQENNKVSKVFRISEVTGCSDEMLLVEYVGGRLAKMNEAELKEQLMTSLPLDTLLKCVIDE